MEWILCGIGIVMVLCGLYYTAQEKEDVRVRKFYMILSLAGLVMAAGSAYSLI
ncbi:hypothetical protein [uncultured Megasphaera sp.]|uniref:hypothetical protein n=1 Tax=uncultured Megasphaera sp. TaxID=165188 RepID=UPI0026597F67|nr:hypothetical protein [uncultured Megasphaera sp.]